MVVCGELNHSSKRRLPSLRQIEFRVGRRDTCFIHTIVGPGVSGCLACLTIVILLPNYLDNLRKSPRKEMIDTVEISLVRTNSNIGKFPSNFPLP